MKKKTKKRVNKEIIERAVAKSISTQKPVKVALTVDTSKWCGLRAC